MKKILLPAIIIIFTLVSCNQKSKEAKTHVIRKTETDTQLYTCLMHPEVTGKKNEKCPKCGMELNKPALQKDNFTNQENERIDEPDSYGTTTASDHTNDIIISYINLKNRLVKDDPKGAAQKSKLLLESLNRFNTKLINAKHKETYLAIAAKAKQNAEHIANAKKIDHQREHFILLTNNINDLIKMFGTDMRLYQDYCPMANEGKGAIWISETKEIKNPYMGNSMLTCGSIKKTY